MKDFDLDKAFKHAEEERKRTQLRNAVQKLKDTEYLRKLKDQEARRKQVEDFDPNYFFSDEYANTCVAKDKSSMQKLQKSKYGCPKFIHEIFDDYFALTHDEIVAIGAKTKNGKSIVMANIAARIYNDGGRVVLVSNEMEDAEIRRWIACLLLGFSPTHFRSKTCVPADLLAIQNKVDEISKSKRLIVIDIDNPIATSSELLIKMLRNLDPSNYPDIFMLDYLTNIESDDKSKNDYQVIDHFLKEMRNVSRNNFPSIIATQMHDDARNKEMIGRFLMGNSIGRFCTTYMEVRANKEKFETTFDIGNIRNPINNTYGKVTMGWLKGKFVPVDSNEFQMYQTNQLAQVIANSSNNNDLDDL